MEQRSKFEVIADWWTDQLRQEPHDDNGDAFQSVMKQTMVSKFLKPPSEEQLAAFRQAMLDALPSWISSLHSEYDSFIGVDYDPDPVLVQAAAAAGIPNLHFPWKTRMWIRDDEITVACGYGAPGVSIWQAGVETKEGAV